MFTGDGTTAALDISRFLFHSSPKKKEKEGSKQETRNNRFSLNPKLYENDIYRNIIATIDRAPRMFVRAYTEKEEKSEGGAEIYRRRARLNTGSKRRNELPTNRLPAIPLFYIPCWTETRRPLSSSSSLPRLGKRPRVLSPKAIGLLFRPLSFSSSPSSTSPLKAVAPSGASRLPSQFAYRKLNFNEFHGLIEINPTLIRSSKEIIGEVIVQV